MPRDIYNLTLFILLTLTACQSEEVTIAKPKLDYYIESFEVQGAGLQPQTKVTYEYNSSGKVSKYTVASYNSGSTSPIVHRYVDFSYMTDRVDQIKGYLPDSSTPFVEYSYQYLSDTIISKITEKNNAAGVSSEANFSYDPSKESVKVAYRFSNGGSFEYEFYYSGKNILTDKTTRGSELCNTGEYTYDQHVNPFRNLGYVDYFLTNVSSNNRLTEKINYVACSFPNLEPESYAYEYNENGYPTTVTTTYKSGLAKGQKKFFYK